MSGRLLLCACMVTSLASASSAQMFEQWRHKHDNPAGGDDGLGGVTTDDGGNYYVTGSENHGIGSLERILVLKYSPSGRVLWRYLHGSLGSDSRGYAVIPDNQGGCYVAGVRTLLKLNREGQLVWASYFPGFGRSVVATDTGIFVTSSFDGDVWVGGFNIDGNLVWFDTFDSGNQDWGEQIQLDRAGDLVVTATLNNVHSSQRENVGLFKYSKNGVRKWAKSISLSYYSENGSATVDNNNDIVLAGTANNDGYTCSTFVMKVDSRGGILWSRITDFHTGRDQTALGQCDALGNIYLATSQLYGPVLLGIKYSPDGDLLHKVRNELRPYRVGTHASDELGNIYLPVTESSAASYRPSTVVCKIANTGDVEWRMPMYDRNYHHYPAAALAPDNSVYVSNQSSPGSGWDLLSAKFAPQ